MSQQVKIVKVLPIEEKDIGNEILMIAQSEKNNERDGIYMPASTCDLLNKLIDNLYIEKFSTESSEVKKKYDFLFYLRSFIKKNIS